MFADFFVLVIIRIPILSSQYYECLCLYPSVDVGIATFYICKQREGFGLIFHAFAVCFRRLDQIRNNQGPGETVDCHQRGRVIKLNVQTTDQDNNYVVDCKYVEVGKIGMGQHRYLVMQMRCYFGTELIRKEAKHLR